MNSFNILERFNGSDVHYMLKACTAGLRNTRFSPLYLNTTVYLLCKVTGFIQKNTLFDLLNSKGESDC